MIYGTCKVVDLTKTEWTGTEVERTIETLGERMTETPTESTTRPPSVGVTPRKSDPCRT